MEGTLFFQIVKYSLINIFRYSVANSRHKYLTFLRYRKALMNFIRKFFCLQQLQQDLFKFCATPVSTDSLFHYKEDKQITINVTDGAGVHTLKSDKSYKRPYNIFCFSEKAPLDIFSV